MDVVTLGQAKDFAKLLSLGFADVTVSGTTVILTLDNGQVEEITFPTPKDGVSLNSGGIFLWRCLGWIG